MYRKGNYQQALSVCLNLFQESPDHGDVISFTGMIYSSLGDYRHAEQFFHQALDIDPQNPYTWFHLGNVRKKAGKPDEAIESYQAAIHFRPDFAEGYFALGNIHEEKQMFHKAASWYRKLLEIHPDYPYAYARLGFVLYNTRHLGEAIKALETALQVNPFYDEIYCCLSMIHRETGRYEEAVACCEKALKINPESAWAYTNLGVTLQHQGRYKEGQRYLHKALEKNPNLHGLHHKFGHFLMHDQAPADDKIHFSAKGIKKILIVVSAFNRGRITALSLSQMKRYKTNYCHLQVYNDHSSEYDNRFLARYADEVIQLPEKMGIDRLRCHQFKKFLESDFEFLYLTDNDVIHDPDFIPMMEQLYQQGNEKLPVSLFNSIFTLRPKMILSYKDGLFVKSTAPGNSMFYDRRMVEKLLVMSERIRGTIDYLPWDNKAIACLGLPWITPEQSYLEHFGSGGVNSSNYERDRAVNPTVYLRERREQVLRYLMQDIDRDATVNIVF